MKARTPRTELKTFVTARARGKSLSLKELASRAEVSQAQLLEILDGQRELDVALGFKIAREIRVSPVQLCRMAGKEAEALDAFAERFRRCAQRVPEFARKVDDTLTVEEAFAE